MSRDHELLPTLAARVAWSGAYNRGSRGVHTAVAGVYSVVLANEGFRVVDPEQYPNGRFARVYDPEGNPVELWEPQNPS